MARLILAAALIGACHGAWAQDSRGAYMGASIGQASYKHTCDGAPAGIACDNSDTAWRLFAGYQVNRRSALELGFHSLGTPAATGSGPSPITETADISAIDLVYAGNWPIANRFSLLAKLGLYFARVEANPPPAGTPARNWETSRNNDLTYGLGVSYVLTDHAEWRFEWQHFGHVGTGSTPALDIHLFSLGAVYRF